MIPDVTLYDKTFEVYIPKKRIEATVLDLVLPRIAAGVPLERRDFVAMGEGGLCLGCTECTFPHCPFGR